MRIFISADEPSETFVPLRKEMEDRAFVKAKERFGI